MDGSKLGEKSGEPYYCDVTKMNLSKRCKKRIFSLIMYFYFMVTRTVRSG
jgi:hypothetical protein